MVTTTVEKSGFVNPFKNGYAACLCLIIKKGKEKCYESIIRI